MNHHAYFVEGDIEEGMARASAFASSIDVAPADVELLRFGLFSVDDARKATEVMHRWPIVGSRKLVIIAATRVFHEAQNALLKISEEPPEGAYLVLVIPSEGILLPTLRSRLLALPGGYSGAVSQTVRAFIKAGAAEREKLVGKLLERAKSDKPEEKQAARAEALVLAEGLMRAADQAPRTPDTLAFLSDLDRFIPILHERAAPLKPILEHLVHTVPANLKTG